MNNGSNVNTILLVVVLLLLVGGGIWWYMAYGPGKAAPAQDNGGIDINIGGTVPAGSGENAGAAQ